MDLSSKLRRLRRGVGGGHPVGTAMQQPQTAMQQPQTAMQQPQTAMRQPQTAMRQQRIAQLGARMAEAFARGSASGPSPARWAPHSVPDDAARPLPGALVDTEHGTLHVIEQWLEPDHHHGRAPVSAALQVSSEVVSLLALAPELAELDLSRMLLLDTETTGLAGGMGTIPFLVGVAHFEDGALCTEQWLLRGLGQERPILARLAERMAEASCLVTYNGKSFDWPLLRNRFIATRTPAPSILPHLDLLHCAQRVLKARLGQVRLVDVEAKLLGFVREHDVRGADIPTLYFRFLRGAPQTTLTPIVEHNAMDLIALAAILGRLGQQLAEDCVAASAQDELAYARLAERARDHERARRFARRAADNGSQEEEHAQVRVAAWMLTARIARRQGEYSQAVEALLSGLELAESPALRAELHLTLAKLYEHRLRDFARARRHATHTALAEGPEAQQRRELRLGRKQARPTR